MEAVCHSVAFAHTLVGAVMEWVDRMPVAGYMLVADTSHMSALAVHVGLSVVYSTAQDIEEIEGVGEVVHPVSPHFRGWDRS